MNFQTSLPYATDSDLHVIEGLDVGGTPIYQRTGLDRFLPVDMYTLLQGIIERCLATRNPDGSYLVSPTIFDETMKSTTEDISYAPISTWIERTYPNGELNQVTGYVANLMDMYPQNLILQAIDDKLWALGSCSSGVHEVESCYGNLKDTAPFWEAFRDITFAMTQAGVGFSYDSFEMVLIPARASGTGADVYGAPAYAVRIYPEMLIARYKVMQQLRYKKVSWSVGNLVTSVTQGSNADGIDANWCTLTQAEWESRWKASYEQAGELFTVSPPAGNFSTSPLGATPWEIRVRLGPAGIGGTGSNYSFFNCTRAVWWSLVGQYDGKGLQGTMMGYPSIPHDIRMYAYWDGVGSKDLFSPLCDLVPGKNTIFEESNVGEETDIDCFVIPTQEDWLDLLPVRTRLALNQVTCKIYGYTPIEDWKFEFCKHSDFGGDVTWHV